MTKADLYEYICRCRLGVLGSIGPDGRPQSSLVGIAVTESLEILFDTVKNSRKYGNLISRPSCSFALGWDGEQTIQYEGEATELSGTELERLQPVYFEQWPESRSHLSWPGIVYFVVRPRWIRFSDYDRKPPLIQEFPDY
jgi:pyridoxine/pyridoxamine 5'-phosphate oxidase